jgi:hypothetical protein
MARLRVEAGDAESPANLLEVAGEKPPSGMQFTRGKIKDVITGPRWRVKHHAAHASAGVSGIVGGKDEEERGGASSPSIASHEKLG